MRDVLLTIDIQLGLVVLVGTPLILFVLQFGGPVITRRVADQQELAGEATAMSADLIAGSGRCGGSVPNTPLPSAIGP